MATKGLVPMGEKGWDPRFCCHPLCGYQRPTRVSTDKCRTSREGVGAPFCDEHACPTCAPLLGDRAGERIMSRVVEELCQDDGCKRRGTHWHLLSLDALREAGPGEYTITVRVRDGARPKSEKQRTQRG
jgi:hypothetical protein